MLCKKIKNLLTYASLYSIFIFIYFIKRYIFQLCFIIIKLVVVITNPVIEQLFERYITNLLYWCQKVKDAQDLIQQGRNIFKATICLV